MSPVQQEPRHERMHHDCATGMQSLAGTTGDCQKAADPKRGSEKSPSRRQQDRSWGASFEGSPYALYVSLALGVIAAQILGIAAMLLLICPLLTDQLLLVLCMLALQLPIAPMRALHGHAKPGMGEHKACIIHEQHSAGVFACHLLLCMGHAKWPARCSSRMLHALSTPMSGGKLLQWERNGYAGRRPVSQLLHFHVDALQVLHSAKKHPRSTADGPAVTQKE